MVTRYATPTTTQAEIQDWLNARDYVVLAAGSQYDLIVDQLANSALGWSVPAGATLDINGAVVNFAAVLNQTKEGLGAAAIGCQGVACGVVRNGVVRAADDRVVPGQPVNHVNTLLNFRAPGVAMNGLIEDVTLLNGPNQALMLNDVKGMTIRRLKTPRPPVAPTSTGKWLGHYVHMDVTGQGRYTEDVVFDDCDLDSFGQECFKAENSRHVRFARTRFRNYVALVQDAETPYSELDDFEFDTQCTFYSYVSLQHLRRRWNGSGYDNLGGGRIKLRGRMVGDDALIIGVLKSPAVSGTEEEQFSNLKAEFMSFEGSNSHLVPLPDSSWITSSVGVKQRVTIYVRSRSQPQYPFGVNPCVVAGNVGANTTLSTAVQTSLLPNFVAPYYLDRRGARVSVAAGTWTGAQNLQGWPSLNQNVPVDFIGEGGSTGTIIDAAGSTSQCLSVFGTNNRHVRFVGFRLRGSRAGTSSRGWLVNNAAANVEFQDVVSEDCSCSNGGAGGRAQNYSRLILGSGTIAIDCHATGSSSGGGFLIDLAGAGVSEIEGVRAVDCSAGGLGGGVRISSPNCRVRSLELVNNVSAAGAGGLALNVSSSAGLARISGVSGRGNAGAAGVGSDFHIYAGNAGFKVVARSMVLGSGGTVMSKAGSGTLEYGDINIGPAGAFSISGGVNTNLGNIQTSDPLFVSDPTSVALADGSPCLASAVPQWTVDVERVPVGVSGDWFQVAGNGMTTMGACPEGAAAAGASS